MAILEQNRPRNTFSLLFVLFTSVWNISVSRHRYELGGNHLALTQHSLISLRTGWKETKDQLWSQGTKAKCKVACNWWHEILELGKLHKRKKKRKR